jgi:hypothetical protein
VRAEGLPYLLKDRLGDVEQLVVAGCGKSVAGRSVIDPEVVEALGGGRGLGELAARAPDAS